MDDAYILLLCAVILFSCKKENKPEEASYENKDITLTLSFIPVETSIVGVANAIVLTGPSTTSGYVDMLVNGQNKGSQAAFDEENMVNGKYIIKPIVKVGLLTLALSADAPAVVLIESDLGGNKDSKTYTLEPNKMLQLQFP